MYDVIFAALNASVLPAWALLIFLPRAGLTQILVHSFVYPLGLGLFYIAVFLMVFAFGMGPEDAHLMTLSGIMTVFSHPLGLMVGWSHYLVFDLFVGAWIARDGHRRGIPHMGLVPCLLLTWLLGPVGLALYALLRMLSGRGTNLVETT